MKNDNIAVEARKIGIDFRTRIYELVSHLTQEQRYVEVIEVCRAAHGMYHAINTITEDDKV